MTNDHCIYVYNDIEKTLPFMMLCFCFELSLQSKQSIEYNDYKVIFDFLLIHPAVSRCSKVNSPNEGT